MDFAARRHEVPFDEALNIALDNVVRGEAIGHVTTAYLAEALQREGQVCVANLRIDCEVLHANGAARGEGASFERCVGIHQQAAAGRQFDWLACHRHSHGAVANMKQVEASPAGGTRAASCVEGAESGHGKVEDHSLMITGV